MIDVLPLIKLIANQYTLDPLDTHGLSHWGRVLENGLKIADTEGGDLVVISLFAIFHDACRHNQSFDPGHGARAAELARELLGDQTYINSHQLDLLTLACHDHTAGKIQADLTVQICWDADRLDLARAAIMPHHSKLCTKTAKSSDLIEWANKRALSDYTPDFVTQQWIPVFRQYLTDR
jgi:uncharacterized protein